MSALYLLSSQPTGLTTVSSIGQFFYILLLLAFVVLLAYYSTRLMAASRGGRLGAKRNMQIVEGIGVGVNATVQIVRVGERYYLLGVTKESVTLLTPLDESQIAFPSPQTHAVNIPFNKIFDKIMKREAEAKNQDEANDENSTNT
jgi:flagellar protein FliO/FliZ